MATLSVNVLNRPHDEIIDCGPYGLRLNMKSYEIPGDKDVVLGFPLENGKKLPVFQHSDDMDAKYAETRAQAAGATTVSTGEFSGIRSTDLPGGVTVEAPSEEPKTAGVVAKPKTEQPTEEGR